jgi:BTB/POZ domain-containing protein KCTD9
MTNNPPTIDELRESFNRVYNGPDRLQREYDLVMEAEQLGVPLDTYRRLYELRGEEHIDPYPKPKHWWRTPGDWGKWIWHLPPKKKLALGRKGVVKLVQSGVILTVIIALGRYVWEAPKREKLAHYQAWQIINSAQGQKTNGGRIDALQDLVKDGVYLSGLDASGAYLAGINLKKGIFGGANFQRAYLVDTNLQEAYFWKANFKRANLVYANLQEADFEEANLQEAYLAEANLRGANLQGTNFTKTDFCTNYQIKTKCADFRGAKGLTPEQIKKAIYWQQACYDPEFRKQLGLPPENPKYCAGKDKK